MLSPVLYKKGSCSLSLPEDLKYFEIPRFPKFSTAVATLYLKMYLLCYYVLFIYVT